ncbi:MAG: glycosyltransferase WbuB, partial [Gordonia sp. (in: high G+C Gram-positive bacteria)]
LPIKVLRGSRLIYDQHDLCPELIRAKRMSGAKVFTRVAEVLERLSYKLSDHVIVTNNSYRTVALTRGRVSADDVSVVRSAPENTWNESPQTSLRWKNGRRYMIGYVGVIGRQEGIEYLLNSMKILVTEEGIDVQCVLVGSGPDIARLKTLCRTLELDDHITFTGRVSDDDLRHILATADVCVNPDEVNELNDKSTMNKIIEYMAIGKPIVQFDVAEGRFSAGPSSLYAAPNDSADFAACISKLLMDEELRESMGKKGQQRFETTLAWEFQAPILVRAYESVGA